MKAYETISPNAIWNVAQLTDAQLMEAYQLACEVLKNSAHDLANYDGSDEIELSIKQKVEARSAIAWGLIRERMALVIGDETTARYFRDMAEGIQKEWEFETLQ